MQQGDSAVRLHFLGSLAGLGAGTKSPKKSLLGSAPLDIAPERASSRQQGCREALGRAGCPIRRILDLTQTKAVSGAGWPSPGTAALTLERPHPLLLAPEPGMPRATRDGIPCH